MLQALKEQFCLKTRVPSKGQLRQASLFLCVVILCFTDRDSVAAELATSSSPPGTNPVTITDVFVNRVNIFKRQQADRHPVYHVINRLHYTTREETILQELGVAPGDTIDTNDLAEFERILRRTDLFASVSVSVQGSEKSDNKQAGQLHINTRDRISIVAGASGSFLGGVGELGFTLGERNVAGLGDSLLLSYTGNTENELRGAISYSDLHFINKDQRALYQIGRTEEGDFYRLQFQRPFNRQKQKNAWLVLVESVERDIDFYEVGFSVVQIPERKQALTMSRLWRNGTEQRSIRRGVVFEYKDLQFQPSQGSQASTISAPADSTQYYAGILFARDTVTEYRQTQSLDTLKFTQDLSLGTVAEFQLGFSHTEHTNTDNVFDAVLTPKINAQLSTAFAAGENSLLRFSLNGSATLKDVTGVANPLTDSQPWTVSASARWFHTGIKAHTVATRLDYIFSENDDDLPVQYTLGENNGLRGYASRLLSGRERLRLNIEDRMDFDWRFGEFDVGLVSFFDAGWLANESGAGALKRSAGLGIRLGSNVLLGAGVIRMDVAVPFDDESGRHEPSLSISLGQVFSY